MNIPQPEDVMQQLASLFPVVYSSLDSGVFKAHEFFDKQETAIDKVVDSYLAPNLVRYYAKQAFKKWGYDAQEDNDMSIENVPNNGLYLKYKNYHLRILKSNNGDLPIPGYSDSRKTYYNQGHLNFPSPTNEYGDEVPYDINLLILWDVIPKYSLGNLSIACPKAGGSTKESVITHWHQPIPDVYLLGSNLLKTTPDIDGIRDLDNISPKTAAKTGTRSLK